MLYSPSTAPVSVLNTSGEYLRCWKRSASIARIAGRSSLEKVVWKVVESSLVDALDAAPARLEHFLVFLRRKFVRAAEHQMLEQVREAGLARFNFIARAGLTPRIPTPGSANRRESSPAAAR